MKKLLLLFLLFLVLRVSAQTVYVNNFTNKYHTKDCPKIDSNYYELYIVDAINKDYTACKVCKPPKKVIAESVSVNNSSSNIQVEFSKVINTDSVGKTKLFVTINDWFATNFKSANDVIQMADKEAGIIIGKGTFSYYYEYDKTLFGNYNCFKGFVNYTIKVYIKDNRYKVEVFNFSHEAINSSGYPLSLGYITNIAKVSAFKYQQKYYDDVWKDLITKIKSESEDIFTSLEKATKKVKSENDDDGW